MKGDAKIIEKRRKGQSPKFVYIEDASIKVHMFGTVTLAPEDVPEALDWRFTVGLTVFVSSWSEDRAQRITAEVRKHAKRVVTHVMRAYSDQFGRLRHEVVKMTDTDGVMVWPA